MEQKIIVTGNPIDGLRFIGPVTPNTPEADNLTDDILAGLEWWYASIEDPAIATRYPPANRRK